LFNSSMDRQALSNYISSRPWFNFN
jgi:hypothetical protein